MNRIWTPSKLVILTLILLLVMTGMEAAEGLSGLSGKVVDVEGNAVEGFVFAIQPAREFQDTLSKGETDSEGAFTISDIQPGPVRFIALPDISIDPYEKFDPETFSTEGEIPPETMRRNRFESDKKIISIQIGNLTFFNTNFDGRVPDLFQGFTFALEPGRILEDVKITVKSRFRIRGRVLYADSTPLANAQARLTMEGYHEFHHYGGTVRTNVTSTSDLFTDADGYFTHYPEKPGFYTLSIQYNALSAGAGPFPFKEGVQPEVILLTLPPPRAKSVWIINPTNGHAYKRIQCENYHDAQRKAVEEGAHLVSINDETEQHWIEVIFKQQSFWIGLTDAEKEGEWQWDSGEPVTYTNWTTEPTYPDSLPDAEKDYVVVTFAEGEWQSAGPESPLWRMARWAVIERNGSVSTMSRTPEKAADK